MVSNALHRAFYRLSITSEVQANMINTRVFHYTEFFDKPVYASFNPETVAFYGRFVA